MGVLNVSPQRQDVDAVGEESKLLHAPTFNRHCPICRYEAFQRFRFSHTIVMRCRNLSCGLMFASPQVDECSLEAAYRKHYYPDPRKGVAEYENTAEQVLEQVFQRAETELGPLAGKSLLDYGCGVGTLCRIAREYEMNVFGVEPDSNARGVAYLNDSLEVYADISTLTTAEPGRKFDIITVWDVIEHLREPWAELKVLSNFLKPGGCMLLATPNANCLRAVLERGRWAQIVNPTHFYYFTRKSLTAVLSQAGLSEICELQLSTRYPGHGFIRRIVQGVLVSCGMQGELVYLARC